MRLQWRYLRWPFIVAAILFLGSFIPAVKNSFIKTTAMPVHFTQDLGDRVIGSVKLLLNIGTLARENGQLQSRVNELSALEITNKELTHENELLRRELQFSASQPKKGLIAAEVISRTSSTNEESILVNKGTNQGFKKGMAVIAQGYLVGTVAESLADTSRVVLITSTESLVPSVLQNSRSVGLLKGGAQGLIIDEVPRDVTMSPEEGIVTSNIGDIIKSGIPIGEIKVIISGKSDVFQSARIHSPIDFNRLEVVFGVSA